MSNLVLPNSVKIHVLTWAGPISAPRDDPLTSPAIAFDIHAFARAKNDYYLGPFFSENGIVTITRSELERAAAIELESGIMDYQAITDCFAFMEIKAWSSEQVSRALKARSTVLKRKRFFSRLETEWWGSPAEYARRLKASGNRNLYEPVWFSIRDEWDGSKPDVEYEYRLPQSVMGRRLSL